MKNPEESVRNLARTHGVAPSGVAVAVNQPLKVNQVMTYGGFRFRVTKELTDAEFKLQMQKNRKLRLLQEELMGFQAGDQPGQGGFLGEMKAGKLTPAGTFSDAPPEELKYFYALKRMD